MEFYLSWQNNKEKMLLPVNPTTFEISSPQNNMAVDINNIGEINLIGNRGLKTLTLESFFPAVWYQFCKGELFQPQYYIQTIERWKDSRKPVRLIITETDINMAASIENFTYSQRAGNRNVYYMIDLKEYRFVNIQGEKIVTTQAGTQLTIPSTKRETRAIPTEYTVKHSDTLWGIAKNLTGDGSNYISIAKANNISNPDNIKVGQKLVI